MAIHRFGKLIGLSLVILLLATSPAEAATGQKLGDVFKNLTASMTNFPFILSSVAYILGLFFALWGIFKFKDHVDNPSQNPLSAGVKRFLAGGMLFSGPYLGSVLRHTLFAGSGPGLKNTGHSGVAGGSGMDKMIVDFVGNIYGPISMLLTSFTYIAAVALLLNGIIRLTKTAQEGPRGPTGMGTIMTFLAAGAMFSFGDMMGSFSTSLFGNNALVSTNASIGANVISDSADATRVASVIEAVMAFVTIVGFIAFIRGWFVLKAFADGHNNYTLAQGLTFLFGGVLAINLGELVNVLQNTLGIAATNGITFH